MRAVRASVLAMVLVALAAPGEGAKVAECRVACGTAIEGCITWRSGALRDADLPAAQLRKKARAIRRRCTKAALKECRSAGVGACDVPVFCACGR